MTILEHAFKKDFIKAQRSADIVSSQLSEVLHVLPLTLIEQRMPQHPETFLAVPPRSAGS